MCGITRKLLFQGDQISVERGQLVICPKSGKAVPLEWMNHHVNVIYTEILSATGLTAFRYESYTVGHYGPKKTPGVNLQFANMLTGEITYLVFNAILTRGRTTRYGTKGQRLPAGQFRVNQGHAFTKFWLRLALRLPTRLSAFHECMGKLRPVLITGTVKSNNALDKSSVEPLAIDHHQIAMAFKIEKPSDNHPTNFRQISDNYPTINRQEFPTKKPTKAIQVNAYSAIQVGGLKSGDKEQSNKGVGDKECSSHAVSTPIRPEDQTDEQWLAAYDRQSEILMSKNRMP